MKIRDIDQLTLRDLEIINASTEAHVIKIFGDCSGLIIEDCRIQGLVGDDFENSAINTDFNSKIQNSSIRDNKIVGSGSNAIDLNGGENFQVAISNNQIFDYNEEAVKVNDCGNCRVDSNLINPRNGNGNTENAISFSTDSSGTFVRHNDLVGDFYIPISIDNTGGFGSSAPKNSDIRVIGNQVDVHNNLGFGNAPAFSITGNTNVVVRNNTINESFGDHLVISSGRTNPLTNVIVSNNTFSGNNWVNGVRFEIPDPVTMVKVSVDSNDFNGHSNSGNAVVMDASASGSNIRIRDNEIDSTGDDAIVVENKSNVDLKRNTINDVDGGHGIFIGGSSGSRSNDLLIQNNMIHLVSAKNAGIRVSGSDNFKIYNNSVNVVQGNYAVSTTFSQNGQIANNNLKGGSTATVLDCVNGRQQNVTFNANNYDNQGPLRADCQSPVRTLRQWAQISPDDHVAGAFAQDAQFQSAKNLNLNLTSGSGFLRGISNGLAIDIDGDSRCLQAPTVGADEASTVTAKAPDTAKFKTPDTARPKVSYDVEITGERAGNTYTLFRNGNKVGTGYTFQVTSQKQVNDTLTVIRANCAGKDTMERVVPVEAAPTKPLVNFVADTNIVAPGSAISLKARTQNGVVGYEWSVTPPNNLRQGIIRYQYLNPNDSTAQNPEVFFIEPGRYNVQLVAYNIDANGQRRYDTLKKNNYLEVGYQPGAEFNICESRTQDVDIQRGTLYDPAGLNQDYPDEPERTCNFTIDPCADTIVVDIEALETETGEDYLRIYDGSDASAPRLWDASNYSNNNGIQGDLGDELDGADTQKIATSGTVYVEWESDGDGFAGNEGFALDWQAKGVIQNAPQAKISGPDTIACAASPVTYQEALNQSNLNYEWILDGQQVANGPDFSYQPVGGNQKDTITLVVQVCDFADTVTKPVVIESIPSITQLDFSTDLQRPEVSEAVTPEATGDVVTLSSDETLCVDSLRWEFPNLGDTAYTFVNGTDRKSARPQVAFRDTASYDVRLIASNARDTDTLTRKGYINPIAPRCKPSVSATNTDIGISRFSLREIDNSSSVGNSPYQDFTKVSETRLTQGVQYALTIERQTNFNDLTWKVWIDYDQDGTYNNANELVAVNADTGGQQWTTTLTVPASVRDGGTELRVGAGLTNQFSACGTPLVGEYEDYRVVISPDQTAPEITLQGQNPLQLEACESLANQDTGAVAIDNLDGTLTSSISTTSTVDTANPGNYQITYQVTDQAGNTAQKTRDVIIGPDTTKPSIALRGLANLQLQADSAYQEAGVNASDFCSGLDTVRTTGMVNSAQLGTYELTYTAEYSTGNQATVRRSVTVVDTIRPTITLNGPDTITIALEATFNDPGVTFADNFWPTGTLITERTSNVNTGEVGEYQVTYQVTDSSGNGPVIRERVVAVVDTVSPAIASAARPDTLTLPVFNTLSQSDLVSGVSDNFYGLDDLTLEEQGSFFTFFPAGQPDSVGFFTAELIYTDPSGNSASLSKTIHVVDEEAPVLQLVGDPRITIARWQETSFVDSFTVSDNYYQESELTIDTTGSYFSDYIANDYPSAPATYRIRYQAEDPSGNQSELVTRLVQVEPSTGREDLEEGDGAVALYPNPSGGQVTLDLNLEQMQRARVEVVDKLGQVVSRVAAGNLTNQQYQLDLSDQPAGAYQVRILTEDAILTKSLILTE